MIGYKFGLKASMLAAVILAAVGCGKDDDAPRFEDGIIRFTVAKESAIELESRAEESVSESLKLTSEDGSQSLTFMRTVSRTQDSGLFQSDMLTKGTPVTGSNIDALYGDELYVTALKSDGSIYVPKQKLIFSSREEGKSESTWTTAKPYYWPGENLVFWSWAPNSLMENLSATKTSLSFSYTTPDSNGVSKDAEAQSDLIVANTTANLKSGTASLLFAHALSAIRFEIGKTNDCTIKSISLKGVESVGECTYTPSAEGTKIAWGSLATPKDFTQTFNCEVNENLVDSAERMQPVYNEMPENDVATFMLIPQKSTSDNKISIEIVFALKDAEEDVTLSALLDETLSDWQPGMTYTYSIVLSGICYEGKIISWNEGIDIPVPMEDGDYTFTVDKDTLIFLNTDAALANKLKIASYMKTAPTSSAAAVTYRAEYSLDGGQTWIKYNDIETGISGFTPYHNTGYTTATDVTLTASSRSGIELSKFRWVDDATVADNWDLSKCGIGGEGYSASNPQNTANTYIVKHPGTYRFPCVYGNSVKNGNPTDEGYRSQAEGQTVLGTFINSSGQEIQNSYILKDLSLSPSVMPTHPRAAILWGDAKDANGHLLINNVTLNYDPSEPEDAYISFSTSDRESLVQGNVTIILYDDKNDNQVYDPLDLSLKSQNTSSYSTTAELLEKDIVLWGWQIWVTDASLGPDNIGETGEDGGPYGHYFFMSRNLGWVDGTAYNYIVPERLAEFQIRLTQDKSGLSEVITVLQPAVSIFVGGHGAAYQYGRNIPFFNTECSSNTEVMRINEAGDDIAFMKLAGVTKSDAIFPNITPKTFDNAVTVIANDIRRPEIFNAYQGMDYYFTNLLARDNSSVNTYAQEKKTIYDPSPYGYVIPNPNAFASLKGYTGVTYSGNRNSVIFNDNPNLIFPNTGWRAYNGTLNNWNYSYYFTNSIPTNPGSMICIQMLSPTQFGPHTTGNKNYATAVRPVLENAPSK